jgi:NhaP-type Na+/H+ or K+/H+ antiporter
MSEHDDSPPSGHEIHEDPREPENLILFFFVAVIWGALLTFVLSRYKVLPYTVCVFFSGIAISAIVGQIPEDQQDTFTHSARTWQEIDPHLMLYLFLPILIYGDAISLNW